MCVSVFWLLAGGTIYLPSQVKAHSLPHKVLDSYNPILMHHDLIFY